MMYDRDSPILIIGAGRSGTNLLGHILEADSRFWNNYECRYVWNYGQRTLSHDIRRSDDATERVKRYIRNYFAKMAAQHGRGVVDKTPSNVFRVDFLHELFPEGKIIHMIRDGRDNIVSRQVKWLGEKSATGSGSAPSARGKFLKTNLDHLRAIVARGNLPVDRFPVFLADNAMPTLGRLLTGRPRRWAERFPGMSHSLDVYGPLITAAIQWREGVMHGLTLGRRLPVKNYIEVRYEDLLGNPQNEWARIASFLEIDIEGPSLDFVNRNIRQSNSGQWKQALGSDDMLALESHLRPTLEFLGYVWEPVMAAKAETG